jgi:hypothetical protein
MSEPMKWEHLDGITAMLAFCAGKTLDGEAVDDISTEIAITRQHKLSGLSDETCHVQRFTDGTALAILSAVEQTGYCDTCASTDSYLGYFAGVSVKAGEP